VSITIEEQI